MKTLRALSIAIVTALMTACATTSSESAGGAAPSAPAAQAASISGTWAMSIESPMGTRESTLIVEQTGDALKGTLGGAQGTRDVTGTVNGDQVNFAMDVEVQGTPLHIVYTGKVEGQTMGGTVQFGDFGEGNWSAKKTQ